MTTAGRFLAAVLLVAMLLLTSSAAVAGEPTIDQSSTSLNSLGWYLNIAGMHSGAQTFTAGTTSNLVSVSAYLGLNPGTVPNADLVLEIRDGSFTGELLATGSIAPNAITSSGGCWVNIPLNSPVAQTAGHVYAIILKTDAWSMEFDGGYHWLYGGVYPGGSFNQGRVWYDVEDFMFKTYVSTEPAKPPLVLNWGGLTTITYGTPLGASQLNATATMGGVTVPGNYSYSPPAGTILNAGSYTLSVTFTADPSTGLSPMSRITKLYVNKVLLEMWVPNQDRYYGYPNQPISPVITGVVNGDNIYIKTTTLATRLSPPGYYQITPTLMDPGSKLGNYYYWHMPVGWIGVQGPTFESTRGLVNEFLGGTGLERAMLAQLDVALDAWLKGNIQGKANGLKAFSMLVKAQEGKALTAEQAEILRNCALWI